ncbi:MAG: DUF1207 domain-containing protein [Chlamydiia bacterium]|nr:DUF1207 domain-containing protein [Chlamydiia bacterium]
MCTFFAIIASCCNCSAIESADLYASNKYPNQDFFSGYINGVIHSSSDSKLIEVQAINNNLFVSSRSGIVQTIKIANMLSNISNPSAIYTVYQNRDDFQPEQATTYLRWMPNTYLFEPLIADPRQVGKGCAYRFDDDVFGRRIAEVQFSGEVSILRIQKDRNEFQIGLDGGSFSIFNMGEPTHGHVADLQNADYFGGISFQARHNNIDFRIRFYHISCHIGDDFIATLVSPNGERDKQISWLNKLNTIKATEDPYIIRYINRYNKLLSAIGTAAGHKPTSAQQIDGYTIFAILDHLESKLSNYNSSDKDKKESLKDIAIVREILSSLHGWVFSNKPSYEAIDVAFAYSATPLMKIYANMGVFIRNNPSIDQGKGYIQIGIESQLPTKNISKGLYAQPTFCINILYSDMHNWQPSVTYLYCIDLSNSFIFSKKIRIYISVHSGFSQEGMFKRAKTSYTSMGLKYCY